MLRRVFLIVLGFALAGGAGGASAKDRCGPDCGYVVFSIASLDLVDSPDTYFQEVLVRPQPTGRTYRFAHSPVWNKDWQETNVRVGEIFTARLPAGQYKFYRISVEFREYMDHVTWRTPDFAIPFTVKPGGAVYLGEFRPTRLHKPNFAGNDFTLGFTYSISDEAARDIAIARQKRPALGEVETSIVDAAAAGLPVISNRR